MAGLLLPTTLKPYLDGNQQLVLLQVVQYLLLQQPPSTKKTQGYRNAYLDIDDLNYQLRTALEQGLGENLHPQEPPGLPGKPEPPVLEGLTEDRSPEQKTPFPGVEARRSATTGHAPANKTLEKEDFEYLKKLADFLIQYYPPRESFRHIPDQREKYKFSPQEPGHYNPPRGRFERKYKHHYTPDKAETN